MHVRVTRPLRLARGVHRGPWRTILHRARRRVLPPEPGPKTVAAPVMVSRKSIQEVKPRAESLPSVSALPAPLPTVAESTPAVVRSAAAPRRELTHAEQMHREIARLRAIGGRQRMTKLLMLAVAVFTFTMISWVYLSDEALPSDADLVPMTVPVSADAPPPRAPGRLRLALDTAVTVDVSPASPVEVWRWDTPTLAKTVQANAPGTRQSAGFAERGGLAIAASRSGLAKTLAAIPTGRRWAARRWRRRSISRAQVMKPCRTADGN